MSESKAYRRGIPYKAPETVAPKPSEMPAPLPDPGTQTRTDALAEYRRDELARQEARLRRGMKTLIASTIGALIVVVATGVIVVRQMREQARAEVPSAHADDVPPAKAPPRAAPNKAAPPERAPANPDKKAQVVPKINVGAEPGPGDKLFDKSETQRDRFLSALGNLTGIHLYQSYLNIGLLADSTESEVYTAEEAQKWLDRTVDQLEVVDKHLDSLAKLDLDPEERQGIERCRSVSGLLRTQAMELREYWKKSDKDHAARYHKAREAAWASLSEVLQIPKEPE